MRALTAVAMAFLLAAASLLLLSGVVLAARNTAEATLHMGPLMDLWLPLLMVTAGSKAGMVLVTLALAGACTGAGIGILRRQSWARRLAASLGGVASVLWLGMAMFVGLGGIPSRLITPLLTSAIAAAVALYLMTADVRAEFGETTPASTGRRALAVAACLAGGLVVFVWMMAVTMKALAGMR